MRKRKLREAAAQVPLPPQHKDGVESQTPQEAFTAAAGEATAAVGAESRVQELNRLLLAIREVNRLIVREREPQRLLAESCELLVKTRDYALVWIGLTEPDGKRVVPAACAGIQTAYLDEINVTWDESATGQGPVGAAIRTGQPWLCQDTAVDPGFAPWRKPALARGLASLAAVPMIQAGRVLGALAVYADHREAFHSEEVALVQEIAADLAFALDSIEHETKRRQAESGLHLVSTALEAAANAIAITDREGVVIWTNPAFSQLTGYSLEELRGRKISMLKSGAHDAVFYRQLWDTILAGRVWRSEMVNRRKDGSLYTEENTITPVLNEGGEITHFVAVKQDVTERKRAEAASRQSEDEFRAIFEVASIGMAQTDPRTGQWLRVNQKMCAITGYAADELLQMRVPDITHPEDRQRDWELFQQVVRGDAPDYRLEKRYVRKDGVVAWVNVNMTVIRDAAGRPARTMAAIEDVTTHKLAQAALAQSEERFRTLFELAPDGIYLCDLQGRFVGGNKAAEELVGYARAELIGKSFLTLNLLSASDLRRAAAALARNAQGEATGPEEYELTRKDGRKLSLEIRTFPAKTQQQLLVLGVARDITERKQLEAQFRQAQKMEAIGQLAGGVAHDFNNLLAVMRGNADLLLMDAEQNTSQTNECLKHIAAAAERAAGLTRQLLIFSRKQAIQSEPLALNGLVQNLTKMLKRVIREDIRLECRYAEQLPFVQADPGMLEQALLNLVVNARDAMPRGGQLLIATEGVRFDAASAGTHPDARPGEFVCLSVSDAGTGIAPEHLERIFEPFFTTKEPGKGTGLGLATVYGIVKQHQGWVEVSSRVGVGTTFRILLPAIPPPARTAVAAPDAELRGGSETILLVEDDYSVRMITRHVLETFKYKVHEASCAREAVEVWGRHAGEIALLLTDIVMPEGVTGRELADRLRAAKPGLRVIFLSGYSGDVVGVDTEFFRRTGSCFLHKPCATAILIQTVRQCLDAEPPPIPSSLDAAPKTALKKATNAGN
ncbi:putative Multi-sensor hybrid histidine kinase [Verrucomicrobia bacterium]|nr:putative Multi-sensor hybrid histidine kinase [Verrucomicrobiota bacterium]